jgi:cell division protein FtsB
VGSLRPKDITGRVLRKPLHSPYGAGAGPSWRRWVLLVAAGWLLYVSVLSDHSLWRIMRLRQELTASDAEVKHVRSETHKLEQRLDDPRARADHAEEVLRTQGMARPGEIVYRLGGSAADSTTR